VRASVNSCVGQSCLKTGVREIGGIDTLDTQVFFAILSCNFDDPLIPGVRMRDFRVLIFADEANVLGIARLFNRRIDWLKLRDYLADPAQGRDLIEMVIYVGLPPIGGQWEEMRNNKERFLRWARMNGFLIVSKQGSPTEGTHFKANVDVLMAIDAMEFALEVKPDVVVLVTGDSDFAHLASALRRRGIRVEVAAVTQNLGNELKAAANGVIDLSDIFNRFDPLRGEAVTIGTESVFD
jgi:uncharacterized LabA/DUF88 family protein